MGKYGTKFKITQHPHKITSQKSPGKDMWLSLFSVKLQAGRKHRIVSRVFWNTVAKSMNTNNTKTIENLKIVLHNALAPNAAAPIVILIGSTQRKFLINWTNNARVNNQWFSCISFIFLLYFSKYKQKKQAGK